MSCERHSDALIEHALGAPAPSELQEHLRGCHECRSSLERERRLVAALDDELRAALDVTPSPNLLPRVRAAATEEAARRSTPWLRWLWPLAAAAATLALLAWLRQPVEPPQPAVTTARFEPARDTSPPPRVAEAPALRNPKAPP